MKWSVVPRESYRGDCYNCKSEGLLKFLGSVRINCGRLITASQVGYHLPRFHLIWKSVFIHDPDSDSRAELISETNIRQHKQLNIRQFRQYRSFLWKSDNASVIPKIPLDFK
jgi:hypothetical protein